MRLSDDAIDARSPVRLYILMMRLMPRPSATGADETSPLAQRLETKLPCGGHENTARYIGRDKQQAAIGHVCTRSV